MESKDTQGRQRRIPTPLAYLLFVAALPLLLYGFEVIHRQSFRAPFTWLGQYPLEVVVCLTMTAVLAIALVGLTGRPWLALGLLSGFYGFFALVNNYKQTLIRQPLFPWDIFLHRYAVDLLPQVWRGFGTINLVVLLGYAGMLVLLARFAPIPRLGRTLRVGTACVGIMLMATPYVADRQVGRTLSRLKITHWNWDQIANYRRNGVLLGFALNMRSIGIEAPRDYSPDRIADILPPAETPELPAVAETPADERPNVIVVMSEAFSDPTTLPGLVFSEDPLPHLHRLLETHSSGWLYSPVYAGGTANTEFEFLTGNSMRFLPIGSVPYQQYVKRKLPSLAWMYADRGYRTVAIHTYHRWFWEREQVYQHLGFEKFISSEDLPDAPKDGPYISDAVITDGIIREFEASEDPLFLFAVTMEGHGPYAANRYPETTITIEGPLTDEARVMLEGYVEGLRHADRELQRLTEYFEDRPEPTVIVFFGDHLPLLTPVYEQTGVIQPGKAWAEKERAAMHRIPLLIWQNRPAERLDLGVISASLVGPRLLELTGVPLTPYMRFLSNVGNEMPVLMRGLVADGEGRFHPDVPEPLRELENQWWMLQYDLLFGKEHQLARH